MIPVTKNTPVKIHNPIPNTISEVVCGLNKSQENKPKTGPNNKMHNDPITAT